MQTTILFYGKEGVNLLYPDIEELKRRISQVSTAHNSLLNATSSASVDKDTKNIPNTQEGATRFSYTEGDEVTIGE